MSKVELLNQYVANLAVWNIKLHNLHWNVVGKEFVQIHEFTEAIYDDAFEKFDEVAELLKMKGEMPLSTMAEYLKVATIKEVAVKDFGTKEVLEIVKADLELMNNLATEIRSLADEEGDFTTVAIFEDHVAGYDKNLWFLNSMLK
ncbi:MAG: DNA starvation/stationary phase protection protein [Tissierella sp.]|nr:DNA starvation/stationary phase protection protein [Tissierella sp.]